ncbi:MAG TPA: phosphoglucosamine mutase [Acidimicrobiales bacterium]|nr:phosphoglucosamine mutase [Acidimicrobiales bacterium]
MQFGTDGVRGVANRELTPELVLALGRAAARILEGSRFLVGRDTRLSGPLLQAALSAGLASEGCTVVDLGVVPTPAVAFGSAADACPGAVISASHNPFGDNGVKLFAAGGRKLDDPTEQSLEAELDRILAGHRKHAVPAGAGVGRLEPAGRVVADYEDHLVASLEGRSLRGLRVVVDCSNGAGCHIAPRVLEALGAEVESISGSPDGTNINDGCGSTFPAPLQRAVVSSGADAGLALDGDADRVLAVDHLGALVDGDQVLALCAMDLRARGRLKDDTVVATVMANLGFRRAMAAAGVKVEETAVGDRHVLEALARGGWSLGGEQSGHIIFSDLATTGDGILTGLLALDVVARSGRSLAELAGQVMERLPQVLHNVVVPAGRGTTEVMELLRPAVDAAAAELGDGGRALVRPSGTEPLVRVMVEAATEEMAEATAARLVAEVERVCQEANAAR